jgi:hypothetical protein
MSGHAGEVADDVVAVEAQQRQQLLQDREVLHEDHERQRLEARDEVRPGDEQREDRVEVDAAEVGAQAAAAAEAVGVRDVGVEGRPDDVDADAHDARLRAAVPAPRCVADLVERRRDDDAAEQPEQQRPLVDRGAQRAAMPWPKSSQASSAKRPATTATTIGGRNRALKIVVSARVRPSGTTAVRNFSASSGSTFVDLRARAVGGGEDPERAQLLVGEHLDHVAGHAAADRVTERVGDRVEVAVAVDPLGQLVEQLRELDHLTVRAPDDVRRLLEARVLVLADELDAVGKARRRLRRGRRGGRRGGGGRGVCGHGVVESRKGGIVRTGDPSCAAGRSPVLVPGVGGGRRALIPLRDVCRLLGVRVRDRVVRQHVSLRRRR